jgi:hypothetical protein
MARARCALLLATLIAGGCEGKGQYCALGAEHEVMHTSSKEIDAIDLVAQPQQVLAFWSEPAGLFGRRLDAEGKPLAPVLRVAARCDGGLDAIADGEGVAVACLVRPLRDKPDDAGGVLLLHLGSDLRVEHSEMVGSAGELSEGVALARSDAGLELAWHDGSPLAQRVWWTGLASRPAPRVVSATGRVAAAPSMAVLSGRSLLAWAETWVEQDGLHGRIAATERSGGVRTLQEVKHVGAMPQLFALGSGLVLGFRDLRPGSKTGLYLTRVTDAGAPRPTAARVGRADGVGRPALEGCMGGVVAATPRTYGGDYFVGVNWLDASLQRTRGEQQFYQDSHAFTQVAVTCAGARALLLIAEFPQLQRDSAALRAVPYHCR